MIPSKKMITPVSCWICRINTDVDYHWTVSIWNLLDPFQNHQTTCQFVHHLHHMAFTSSSPFRIISDQFSHNVIIHFNNHAVGRWHVKTSPHRSIWTTIHLFCSNPSHELRDKRTADSWEERKNLLNCTGLFKVHSHR